MKITNLIIALLLFSTPALSVQNPQKAGKIAAEAIEMMNNGQYQEAAKRLDDAIALDSTKPAYKYEKGLCFYQLELYEKALDILLPLKNHPEATEQVYQLIGNSYDYLEEKKKAIEVYRQGLKKFPDSGRLLMEMGIANLVKDESKIAVGYWEAGVKAEPQFPTNYFHLSMFYSKTGEKIWSLIYGEIHQHLASEEKKIQEMSKLLFDTYNQAFFTYVDSVRETSFTGIRINFDLGDTNARIPFTAVYQKLMEELPEAHFSLLETRISISRLHEIRRAFIEKWFEYGLNKRYNVVLFNFHKELIDEGLFEAYNYLMFNQGNPEEFSIWAKKNMNTVKKIYQRLMYNPLKITDDNFFHRTKFE